VNIQTKEEYLSVFTESFFIKGVCQTTVSLLPAAQFVVFIRDTYLSILVYNSIVWFIKGLCPPVLIHTTWALPTTP